MCKARDESHNREWILLFSATKIYLKWISLPKAVQITDYLGYFNCFHIIHAFKCFVSNARSEDTEHKTYSKILILVLNDS